VASPYRKTLGGVLCGLALQNMPPLLRSVATGKSHVLLPDLNGVEATRAIASDQTTATRVLIPTTFDLDEYVYGALRAGARGFLLRDSVPEELIAAIRTLAAAMPCSLPVSPVA
jgi:DNA-binding NarL/FixJ family response regulator